jgi:hypothetical protein
VPEEEVWLACLKVLIQIPQEVLGLMEEWPTKMLIVTNSIIPTHTETFSIISSNSNSSRQDSPQVKTINLKNWLKHKNYKLGVSLEIHQEVKI